MKHGGHTPSHWDAVYESTKETEVSWFQDSPATSLSLFEQFNLQSGDRILDVGGGASRLVDELIVRGQYHVGVLDISAPALERSKARLGTKAVAVEWIVADVTQYRSETSWDVWHDRAVFHFLVDEQDRSGYRDALRSALRPGGHAIIATFGPEGPDRCSGLPVERYDPETLTQALGPGLTLGGHAYEEHVTPAGNAQQFLYCWFLRDEE